MIAKLRGTLDAAGEGWVVVDVGGVGYLVYCSARTLSDLPPCGGPLSLLIDTHVREDHIHLYGFAEVRERDWFGLLRSVQGVGARVALGILSALSPAELLQAVALQDPAPLTRANGVGAKLAKRIVAELKDRLPVPAVISGDAETGRRAVHADSAETADAVSALVNLGYRRVEAHNAVAAITRELGANAAVEELIRGGLRELGR